ncbi:hypothetical protein DL95DRAFT_312879, partial [Leptodontidium sp. 2 PMI_412]
AVRNGHHGVVRQLLGRAIVNPNSRDVSGRTPLMIAVQKGQEEVARLLLGNDEVDVNC